MKRNIKIILVFSVFIAYSCSSKRHVTVSDLDSYSGGSEYAKKYGLVAVKESQRSGVPASITLAQGILESGNGKSVLARKSNNHFGIKCHRDWDGKRVYHDDDEKNECFRKYPSVYQSYLDHSNFLRKHQRYAFLFSYKSTEYKKWAKGLKKAGYATSSTYAENLIGLIERYDLTYFDGVTKSNKKRKVAKKEVKKKKKPVIKVTPKKEKRPEEIDEELIASNSNKIKTKKSEPDEDSDISAEDFEFDDSEDEYIDMSDEIQESIIDNTYKQNGLKYVEKTKDASFADIAFFYNLEVEELLAFNDLEKSVSIAEGDKVYIEEKKINAEYKHKYHIVKKGDTMHKVSQEYGIKLSELYNKNGLEEGTEPQIGLQLLLRGEKSDYLDN